MLNNQYNYVHNIFYSALKHFTWTPMLITLFDYTPKIKKEEKEKILLRLNFYKQNSSGSS
jgi:hypothetical protein